MKNNEIIYSSKHKLTIQKHDEPVDFSAFGVVQQAHQLCQIATHQLRRVRVYMSAPVLRDRAKHPPQADYFS
jgi:hypothetical protein